MKEGLVDPVDLPHLVTTFLDLLVQAQAGQVRIGAATDVSQHSKNQGTSREPASIIGHWCYLSTCRSTGRFQAKLAIDILEIWRM